jgi:8-oxo-dGTP diphosphatase
VIFNFIWFSSPFGSLLNRKAGDREVAGMDDFVERAGQNGPMTGDTPVPAPPPLSRPIVGVGAVIWNDRDEIVLIRRGQEPRRGEWSIPGGKLEWGEALKDALLREVREETGLTVEISALIDVVDSVTRDQTGTAIRHYVLVDFAARHLAGELCAGSDAAEARWVPYAALDAYSLWTETRRIIETAARMRS